MKWKKKEKKERKEGEGDVIKSKWREGECNEWGSRYRGREEIDSYCDQFTSLLLPPTRKNINYTEIGSRIKSPPTLHR